LLLLSSRHRGSVLFAHLLSCSDWLRQRRSAGGGVVSNGHPREPTSARANDWQAWAGPSIVLSASRPLAMVSKVREISEMNYRSSSRYPFLSPNQPSGNISRNWSIISVLIDKSEECQRLHVNAAWWYNQLWHCDRSCGCIIGILTEAVQMSSRQPEPIAVERRPLKRPEFLTLTLLKPHASFHNP
jgi:hypothetical protein